MPFMLGAFPFSKDTYSGYALIPRRGSSDPIVTGQAHNRVFFVTDMQLRGFRKSRFQFGPPLIVKGLHFGNLIRVLSSYVLRLPRVFR